MIRVKEHVPLAALTTFQIGGAAKYFIDVRDGAEAKEAIAWANERGVHFVVLGGGSNVLVPDEGLDSLVIRFVEGRHGFVGHDFCDAGWLAAEAGCNLYSLIREASSVGDGGWEKLAGIPGTIGGAVRGNAGAFGTEIKDVVIAVRALNARTFEIRDFENNSCDFSYRHSFFKDRPEWIITRVFLRLSKIDARASKKIIEETIVERERRHLQNVRAAGSFFMNPVAPKVIVEQFEAEKSVASRGNRVPAGWLIEKVGMKGARVGGAIASHQHPNYLVNADKATAHDMKTLAENIKAAVAEVFGIALHEEAAILT